MFGLKRFLQIGVIFHFSFLASAQSKFVPNYDEAKVPDYTLPDVLTTQNSQRISTVKTWEKERRPEILNLFETEVYGRALKKRLNLSRNISVNKNALDGKATRKEITLEFSGNGVSQTVNLLIYLPNKVSGSVPLVLGMNFYGNHTIHSDSGITLSTNWMRANPEFGIVNHRATEKSRGVRAERWPVEMILERGYGLATIYYGDLVPDDASNGLPNGIHRLFANSVKSASENEEWAAISAWAWVLAAQWITSSGTKKLMRNVSP